MQFLHAWHIETQLQFVQLYLVVEIELFDKVIRTYGSVNSSRSLCFLLMREGVALLPLSYLRSHLIAQSPAIPLNDLCALQLHPMQCSVVCPVCHWAVCFLSH